MTIQLVLTVPNREHALPRPSYVRISTPHSRIMFVSSEFQGTASSCMFYQMPIRICRIFAAQDVPIHHQNLPRPLLHIHPSPSFASVSPDGKCIRQVSMKLHTSLSLEGNLTRQSSILPWNVTFRARFLRVLHQRSDGPRHPTSLSATIMHSQNIINLLPTSPLLHPTNKEVYDVTSPPPT